MKAKISFIIFLLVATLMMTQIAVFASDTRDGSNDNSCEGGSCSISDHQNQNNFKSGSDNMKDNQNE